MFRRVFAKTAAILFAGGMLGLHPRRFKETPLESLLDADQKIQSELKGFRAVIDVAQSLKEMATTSALDTVYSDRIEAKTEASARAKSCDRILALKYRPAPVNFRTCADPRGAATPEHILENFARE